MVDRFPTESNFQDDLSSKRVFSYKFVSAVNTSKNSSPNKCRKYSCGNTVELSWGINRRKLYGCWNNI